MRLPLVLISLVAVLGFERPEPPRVMRAAVGSSRVRLTFTAVADSFHRATREYDSLWTSDGERMVQALERAARLSFADIGDTVIHVRVFEGVSNSGNRPAPMQLRASYPIDIKKAALMHELGHRLQADLPRASADEHRHLFLWLYDAWSDVYGAAFAADQVVVETRRGGVYPAAWESALALSASQRAARWDSIRTKGH